MRSLFFVLCCALAAPAFGEPSKAIKYLMNDDSVSMFEWGMFLKGSSATDFR